MKKLLSLVMALMMLFTFTAAFAQSEEIEMEEFTIEVNFEGTMFAFESGFQVGVPNEWGQLEMDGGVAFATEDGLTGMTISYVEGEVTFEQVAQILADNYGDVNCVLLNDIAWATCTDYENDQLIAAALGTQGFYLFTFAPASDEALTDLATQIMATIKNS